MVYDGEGSILLLERQGAHAAGTWACPGGWIDPEDESPEDACVRELEEEIGLTDVNPADLTLLTSVKEWHEAIQAYSVTIYYCLFHIEKLHGHPTIKEPNKCSLLHWWDILPENHFPKLDIAWQKFDEYFDSLMR